MTAHDRRRRVELAHAEDAGDALPGGIALTFEATEIGGCNGEGAVIEELADGLYGLADVAAELGGGVAQDRWTPEGGRPAKTEVASEAVVEGSAGDAVGDLRPACQSDSEGCMDERSLPTSASDRTMAANAGPGSSRRPRTPPLPM